MGNKVGSRISAGILAALTLGALVPAAVLAQTRSPVSRNFIPGTTYSGGNAYGGNGNLWWYGGGAAAYGAGVGNGMNDNSNQLLYPTVDGPQPTTTPVPSYQTEMMDDLATQHRTPHTEGPSMSFNTDDVSMPKVSSYFHGFYQDLQAGAQYGRGRGQQWNPQSGPPPEDQQPQQPQFQRPPVQSRLSSGDFRSRAGYLSGTSVGVRSDLRPKMQEVDQMFRDLKASGNIGTFDLDPLQQQLDDLHRRMREVDNIQSDVEQRAEEGKLINDIDNFEYQLRQHANQS